MCPQQTQSFAAAVTIDPRIICPTIESCTLQTVVAAVVVLLLICLIVTAKGYFQMSSRILKEVPANC